MGILLRNELLVDSEALHGLFDFVVTISKVLVDLIWFSHVGAEPLSLRFEYLAPVNIVIAWHQE